MKSSEKLEVLPSNPLGKYAIFDVQSIADLRSIVTGDTGLPASMPYVENGTIAHVLGYYSKNDGGGGTFVFDALSVVADDNGLTIAPTNGLGRWVRQIADSYNVRHFGAKGDGVAIDSTAFQNAINAAYAAGGGFVSVPAGTYLVSDVTIKSSVTVQGVGVGWDYYYDGTLPRRGKIKLAAHSKAIFKAGAVLCGACFKNLNFEGYGRVATFDCGLTFAETNRCTIDSCSFYMFSGEAILTASGTANRFTNLLIFGADNSAPNRYLGGIDLGSTDDYLCNIESGSGNSGEGVNLYLCAYILRGGAAFLVNCIAESSDTGFLVLGENNNFVNCRADINYGHGYWLKRIDVTKPYPGNNRFIGCWAHRNSRFLTGTYSGFMVNDNSISNCQFIGCRASVLNADGYAHKYGFYDNGAEHTSDSTGNAFVGCASSGHTDKWLKGGGINTGAAATSIPSMTTVTEGETPDVSQVEVVKLNYAAPQNITGFINGTPGQDIYIIATNGNITLVHSGTFVVNTGANKVLTAGQLYHMKNVLGNWQEIKSA